MNKKSNEKGMALLMVIWMVVLLTAIAAEYSIHMRTDLMVTESMKEEAEAYYMAIAGYNAALAELMQPIQAQYSDANGQIAFGALPAGPDSLEIMPFQAERGAVMETGAFSYTIKDEQGKFALNTLMNFARQNPNDTSPSPLDGFKELLRQSGVQDEVQLSTILDSLIDWMDMGEEHQPNGAEDDWYERHYEEQGVQFPYKSPDARRIFTLDELLLIRGMTPEILYGSAAVNTATLVGKQTVDAPPGAYLGIQNHISAHNRGQPTNKMTADPIVLATYYPQEFDSIMAARQAGLPLPGSMQPSRFFSVVATGWSLSGKTHHSIKASILRMDRGGSGAQILAQEWIDNYLLESLPPPGTQAQ